MASDIDGKRTGRHLSRAEVYAIALRRVAAGSADQSFRINDAQADALMIEARAKIRLAEEYDAAQDRGEVRRANNEKTTSNVEAVSASDIGLTHKDIHEARQLRDAERDDPGIIQRTLDGALAAGEEPTKAKLRQTLQKPKLGWKRLDLPRIGPMTLTDMRDVFSMAFTAAGGPRGAAMYGGEETESGWIVYFSPAAQAIFGSVMLLKGAVDCAQPGDGEATLLCGEEG